MAAWERRTEGGDKPRPYKESAPPCVKNSTAAVTTWRVASAASADDAGPGAPRWELTLVRCRGGRVPRSWQVEWTGTQLVARTKPLRLAPTIADVARRAG